MDIRRSRTHLQRIRFAASGYDCGVSMKNADFACNFYMQRRDFSKKTGSPTVSKAYFDNNAEGAAVEDFTEGSSIGASGGGGVSVRTRVRNILSGKPTKNVLISENATITQAIAHLVTQNLASALKVDANGDIRGIFTARDLLGFINKTYIEQTAKSKTGGSTGSGSGSALGLGSDDHYNHPHSPASSSQGVADWRTNSAAQKSTGGIGLGVANGVFQRSIKDLGTTREKLIYCSPTDTVRRCRELMFQLKIRQMPIIENSEVLGIITMKDLADSAFSLSETGGKKGFIHVMKRKGIPDGTRISRNLLDLKLFAMGLDQSLSAEQKQKGAALTAGEMMHKDLLQQLQQSSQQQAAFEPQTPRLDVAFGAFALPHPFKRHTGVAMNRRLYGADELSTDLSLCEDAHFFARVWEPQGKGKGSVAMGAAAAAHQEEKEEKASDAAVEAHRVSGSGEGADLSANPAGENESILAAKEVEIAAVEGGEQGVGVHVKHGGQVYMCVADGVGSWRQYGVDPRAYSHRLVENALRVVESDAEHRRIMEESPFDSDQDPVHPIDVIMDAWNMTASEGVVGSSTICVATLDKKLNQLSYSNIGDCGLMVLRHIDSETAGYMRERRRPRHLRTNDLRIAYLAQQQLKAFNLPYQLGYAGDPSSPSSDPSVSNNGERGGGEGGMLGDGEKAPPTQLYPGNFESPADADTASIPVMDGDIIILATDGLFDNIDLDDIVDLVHAWETEIEAASGAGSGGDKDAGISSIDRVEDQRSSMQQLAEKLVHAARECSLDKTKDSPFAILAKENDIMWGGGMPDDTTVIVAKVINTNANANMGSGAGTI